MSSTPGTGDEAERQTRYYVLGILTLVYAFNFVDRQILVILQESIKADLRLSDTQLGLLSGTWFAAIYAIAGIPIARLADHRNRRNIIALSLAFWSAMTALSGMAQNYFQLIAARMGLAAGQAGCSPPAHSMISDYFPFSQRATALSIYSTGIFIGIMLAYLAGGWINEFFGWRTAFVVVALPGLIMALILRFTVREPRRGLSDGLSDDEAPPPFWSSVKLLWKNPAFRYIMLGCSFCAFVNTGTGYWVPPYLERLHGMSSGQIGTVLAPIAGIGGAASVFMAGFLSDRLGKGDPRWYLWIPAIGAFFSTPLKVFYFSSSDTTLVLVAIAAAQLLDTFFLGPSIAACHGLVSPRLRALASSFLFFSLTAIGVGFGPLLVGAISDAGSATWGADSLRVGLLTVTMAGPLAALAFVIGGKAFAREMRKKESAEVAGIE